MLAMHAKHWLTHFGSVFPITPTWKGGNTMKTNDHNSMYLAVVVALITAPFAMAWDFRDYNDKAWNSIYKREHAATSRVGRAAAPVIVRNDVVAPKVAKAPTAERSFSYEPPKTATATTSCGGGTVPAAAPSTAKKTVTSRSFSYEPGTSYGGSMVRRGSSGGGNSYEKAMRAKGY
jgi:hypothetical protein